MSPIIQGKTNWKFIIILIFLTTIVAGGILFFKNHLFLQNNLILEENCENLCGDGICQEIVCMMIGCPCPETKEDCPQDCAKEVEIPKDILLIDLDSGINQVGEITLEIIDFLENEKLPLGIEIKPEFPESVDSGYLITYKGEVIAEDCRGSLKGWAVFDQENYKYIIPLQENTGSGGNSILSVIYTFDIQNQELKELEVSKKPSSFSGISFSFRDFRIIYYDGYLYGLFFDRWQGGVAFQSSSVSILAFKNNFSTDELSIATGDYYYINPYFTGVSLIEKNRELYLKIINEHYLLKDGEIIKSIL